MSKLKKILFVVLAVALVICVMGGLLYAVADDPYPTVAFDAASKDFSFANVVYGADNKTSPDADDPYPDLFQVRLAMPGDTMTWRIKVRVDNAGKDTVKMYVGAENPLKDYDKLFDTSNANCPTISVTDPVGGTYASAALNGVGAEPIYIGAYTGDTDAKYFDVTFAIPLEAGNEFANLTASIDWVFYAEIIPYEEPEPTTTPTPTAPPGPTPTTPPGPTPPPGGGGEEGDDPLYPPPPELNTEDHFGYIIGVPGGEVRPEQNITRAETATILFRLLTDESRDLYWKTTNPYPDVPSNAWYNNAISTLTNAGIIQGRPDGTFSPDEPITRDEYAVMFARFFDAVPSARDLFPDIAGHWAREYVNTAAELGFINGRPDGTFGPNEYILRCEAFTLTNRVLGRKPDKDHLHEDMITWVDNTPDKWYYAQVQEATNSHEFQMHEQDGVEYEDWTAITPMRDWAALEKQWAEDNLNGSNVYSSRPNN